MINRTQRSLTILVNYLPASGKRQSSFHLLDLLLSCNKPFLSISSNIYFPKARRWHPGELSLNPGSSTDQLYNLRQMT